MCKFIDFYLSNAINTQINSNKIYNLECLFHKMKYVCKDIILICKSLKFIKNLIHNNICYKINEIQFLNSEIKVLVSLKMLYKF